MTPPRTFRYVLHRDRVAYEAAGWVFSADLGLPHGLYSVLMEWPFESDPVAVNARADAPAA